MKHLLLAIYFFHGLLINAQVRIPTESGTATLTNKTISGTTNTLTNIDKAASITNYNKFPGEILFQDSFHIWTGPGSSFMNIGIGRGTLSSGTIGSFDSNIAIGDSVLANVRLGDRNTIIGFQAGINIRGGNDNTAMGTYALYSDTSGSQNVGIGRNALVDNTWGGNNVALGYYAGRWISGGSVGATIVNNSILIGSLTKPLANNQTNQMVIGDNLTGLGSNTAIYGNSSITYSHIAGNLLTGTTTNLAYAQLNAASTTKGVMLTPKTLTQRNAIASPGATLVTTNTTDNTLDIYNGSTWNQFGDIIVVPTTITPIGTLGNQTINKINGTVNIAAAGTTVTVTNSKVTANSNIYVQLRTNDATAWIKNYVPAAGSFTINLGDPATGDVSIGFTVIN